jgi:hypothetical protein
MKRPLFHAIVASLLCGWYLMHAPETVPLSGKYNTRAPLSQWVAGASFDTAAQCMDRKRRLLNQIGAPLPPPEELRKKGITAEGYKATQQASVIVNMTMQCIASNDPRLKEKP